jgi:DNA-binding response OmpR family regulator
MKRCNGDIKVNSQPHKGTQFRLFFPRYQGEVSKKTLTTDQAIDLSGNERILVVDDEPALLNLNCEILAKQGYHVLRAEDASQALSILETESVDIMLSDIIMPEMNGYELSAIVQEKYPDIKIQLMSGYSNEAHQSKTKFNLALDILQKPYSAQALLARIRALMKG